MELIQKYWIGYSVEELHNLPAATEGKMKNKVAAVPYNFTEQ